jgi:hypothetical protein
MSGGASVAYVFVHLLLPELAAAQESLERAAQDFLGLQPRSTSWR